MSYWAEAAQSFEENSHSGLYFETQSAVRALKQIQSTINDSFPQMMFLLGEPGSGKSFMLNHLIRYYKGNRYCLMIENPYLTPIELLKRVLAFASIDSKEKDVETMRLQAIEAYKDTPHIIMFDEAQLSHAPLREYIRILSDAKVFWFLIAMHTKEGEELLRSPHFYSRAHQVIYMGELQIHECKPYLQKALQDPELWSFVIDMGDGLIKKTWEYSRGNFRNFKKLYYHLFLLLDYAKLHNKSGFLKPNSALIDMAAIKAGLVENKKGIVEFDDLLQASRSKDNRKIAKILVASSILALIGAIGWFGVEYFNQKKSKKIVSAKQTKPIKQEKIIKNKPEQKTIGEDKKDTSKELVFYPPTQKVIFTEEPIPVPQEEVIVLNEYDNITQEPNFLDSEVKPKPKKGPLLRVKNAKAKSIKTLVNQFLSSPNYRDGLSIANIYYDKKDYKNAASWAKKANELNKQKEEAWILFAKSQYKRGFKKDAKAALRLFLDYKTSKKAKILLKQWEKGS